MCVISDHTCGLQTLLGNGNGGILARLWTQPLSTTQSMDNPSKRRSATCQTMLISDQPPHTHTHHSLLYFSSFRSAAAPPSRSSNPLLARCPWHNVHMPADVLKLCQKQGWGGGGAVALSLQRDWTVKKENKPQSAGLLAWQACDQLECLQSGKGVLYSPH